MKQILYHVGLKFSYIVLPSRVRQNSRVTGFPVKQRKFSKRAGIFFLCAFCSLLSCQSEDFHSLPSRQSNERQSPQRAAGRSEALPPEEKRALFPNELFAALVDKEPEETLQAIIDKNGEFLLAENENGDTPLAVAIKWDNREGALFIAKQLSPMHYRHSNHKGESYIYLAALKADVNLIKFLADGFYSFFLDYEFSNLDGKTNEGERALHVAKNAMVAVALEHEYWRGRLEAPFREFQYLQNNQGQTFLHTAVRDQNEDLLRWGVRENCESKAEWEKKPFYEKWASKLWRGVQRYGKDLGLDWDDLINTQDNEGNTAANFSAKNGFYEGARILASCQWTNWLLQDSRGNIPLQNFLLSLDPLKPSHDSASMEMFDFLVQRKTLLDFSDISDHVNSVNQEGNSSLHIAARMLNPYFYEQLKKYGDIEQFNNENKSPREIFNLHQSGLESSAAVLPSP